MLNEMTINGVDISAYNARLQSYSVSGTTVTNNLSASRSILTAPLLFSSVPGTRTLTLTLTFYPHYLGDYAKGLTVSDRLAIATENITVFEGLLVGKVVEIALPDGFIYTAIVNSIAAATFDSSGEHDVTYTFNAVRHAKPISEVIKANSYMICNSNTATPPKLNVNRCVRYRYADIRCRRCYLIFARLQDREINQITVAKLIFAVCSN